jgi:UDP-N-acetyl-alpha-D-muramoyl-L-alanyl-L-glutamate epimerase
MTRFDELRAKHPRFTYEDYAIERAGEDLRLTFGFTMAPDLAFAPTTTLRGIDGARLAALGANALDTFVFHLGLIELLSYWKTACAPEIVIEAGPLDATQVGWWTDLILHGMREFFFVNAIDFRRPDLFALATSPPAGRPLARFEATLDPDEDLVLVSGGKDSAFTLEFLREIGRPVRALFLNPAPAARDVARIAGCERAVVVERTLDPAMLELNRRGYLNGHTPFSAYLAFLGATCAVVYGPRQVIVSNERSCDEPAAHYLGADVIHQYSKTYRFEGRVAAYVQRYLAPDASFFSLLRPLYELQVVKLFSAYPRQLPVFRSCNRGLKRNAWCGECAKCLSMFTALSPFVADAELHAIFGGDLFARTELVPLARALAGLAETRPLECVGAVDETLAAFHLSLEKARANGRPLPPVLAWFAEEVAPRVPDLDGTATRILGEWSDVHGLPAGYAEALRARVAGTARSPRASR